MIQVDRDYVVRILQDLVRINSINPSLDETGAGESEIAQYIAGRMRDLHLDVTVYEPAPGRASVVAVLRGTGGGRSLALNAHVDTVDVVGMPEPFSADIRDGKLYGRGAFDMKGSLAACMGAMKALRDANIPLRGDVELHAVADEEHSSMGTYDLLTHRWVDAAIVTEPTALQICLAHKGFVWLDVATMGRAAHGSQWHLGIDANVHMGRFLNRFEQAAHALTAGQSHPLLGRASMHAALLRGGSGRSTFSANCTVGIERRTLPGETGEQVANQLQALIDHLHADDEAFQATLTTVLVRPPFEALPHSSIVASLEDAATEVLGTCPPHIGENPWMDASLYAERGIDTVVFGATGAGAHSSEEWVDIDSVVSLTACLATTARSYCDVPRDPAPVA